MLPGPRHHANRSTLPHTDALASLGRWTSPWFRFDAGWYAGIVLHGYHWGKLGVANTNFMPLFPALARLVQPVTGGSAWIATWCVANVSFAIALVLLWAWGREKLGRDRAFVLLLLVLSFPFSFFFAAPYAEGLFLALAVGAFLAAEHEQWLWAIALAGATTVTRPVGLAVVAAVVVLAYQRRGIRTAVVALLGCIPLLGFMAYLGVAFGQPLGFMTYHTSGWVAPHGGILHTIGSQFHTSLTPFDRVDVALSVLFLASVPLVWRRLGPAYAVFTAIAVLLPLAHGLAGMERYVAVVFPTFAVWSTSQRSWVRLGAFAITALALPLAVIMYSSGYTIT